MDGESGRSILRSSGVTAEDGRGDGASLLSNRFRKNSDKMWFTTETLRTGNRQGVTTLASTVFRLEAVLVIHG